MGVTRRSQRPAGASISRSSPGQGQSLELSGLEVCQMPGPWRQAVQGEALREDVLSQKRLVVGHR